MKRAVCILIACWAAGCTGTETGNPFDAEMRADAHSSDPAAVDIEAGAVAVDQAWLSLDPIEMIPAGDCDSDQGASAAPPSFGAADHAEAGETLAVFELVEDDYCRARLPFVLATDPLPAGAPPELAGRSIVVGGEVTATQTSFLIASEIDRVIDVRAVSGSFAMTADAGFVFLGFDVAKWLDGVDIASGTPDGNGVIVIDSETNPNLLSAFEANLAGGIELFRDDDRDGSADPAEELLARGQPE